MEILYQVLIALAMIIEIAGDAKGDKHDDYSDLIFRTVTGTVCCGIVAIIKSFDRHHHFNMDLFWPAFIRAGVLFLGYYVSVFPYAVNYVQRRLTGAPWYDHLNKVSIPDKWKWYRSMDWPVRIIGHGVLFIGALIYYFS